MLGTYAIRCGITPDGLSPALSHQQLIDEQLRPLADVITAIIGMSYACSGGDKLAVNSWINEIVLPWTVEITPYLMRLQRYLCAFLHDGANSYSFLVNVK